MRSLFADGLFWLSVACCAIAQIFIIRSIRGVRLQTPSADVPRSRDAVELLWAVLPALVLAGVLVFTWRAIQRNQPADPSVRTGLLHQAYASPDQRS